MVDVYLIDAMLGFDRQLVIVKLHDLAFSSIGYLSTTILRQTSRKNIDNKWQSDR
jgi:hypothetical protein